MGPVAAYDGIADWYEDEFHGGQPDSDPADIHPALRDLLGNREALLISAPGRDRG